MNTRKFPVLIGVQLDAANAEEAIQRLSDILHEAGYVDQEFSRAVLAREEVFPTGLPTDPPVALPHADPDHVREAAVVVGTFKRPIAFHEMGNPEQVLQIRLVFLLALVQKEDAAPLLRHLTLAFRDRERLQALQEASTVQEAASLLKALLADEQGEADLEFLFSEVVLR
jgi:PTS system galactitol-specific IIA component